MGRNPMPALHPRASRNSHSHSHSHWLLLFLTACIQSVHRDGPTGPPVPGGKVRLLEEKLGHGRFVVGGDRIRVDFVGRYASGEVWGRGPLTLVYGSGTYPGVHQAIRVGSMFRM